MESSRITTSRLCSTRRLAFSITISETARAALLVRRRSSDNLALTSAACRSLLRALINQQHDEIALRVVRFDRMGDILQQNGLTGPRRGHDQRPLALPDGSHQINDPGGAIFDRGILDFHLQPLVRIERRQVFKGDLVTGLFGIIKVDLVDAGQGKVTLGIVWGLNDTFNRIARAQRKLPDHFRADIDIIGTGQIVRFGRAQEAKPVLQHFQDPVTGNLPSVLGAALSRMANIISPLRMVEAFSISSSSA